MITSMDGNFYTLSTKATNQLALSFQTDLWGLISDLT